MMDSRLHALAHEHAYDVEPARAERHPNPDLGRPLADGESHYSVDADERESEREACEKPQPSVATSLRHFAP